MKTILDQPRDITIRGHTERFRDHAYLAERIDGVIERIQQVEREISADPAEAAKDWAHIADQAEYLDGALAAQEQWLADYDAIVAKEIDALHVAIGDLTEPSYKEGSEAGP